VGLTSPYQEAALDLLLLKPLLQPILRQFDMVGCWLLFLLINKPPFLETLLVLLELHGTQKPLLNLIFWLVFPSDQKSMAKISLARSIKFPLFSPVLPAAFASGAKWQFKLDQWLLQPGVPFLFI
jgi:hypothetical protein